MPPPLEIARFMGQKNALYPFKFNVTLMFCLYPPIFKCKRLSFHQNLVQYYSWAALYDLKLFCNMLMKCRKDQFDIRAHLF